MSYTPLLAILGLLVVGAFITLTVLFRADRAGLFRRLSAGAYVLFDDDEPPGVPQDQLYDSDHAEDGRDPPLYTSQPES